MKTIPNLPIPPIGRPLCSPLRDIPPGHALFVPASKGTRRQVTRRASSFTSRYPAFRFAVRKARDGRRGCYVWRLPA